MIQPSICCRTEIQPETVPTGLEKVKKSAPCISPSNKLADPTNKTNANANINATTRVPHRWFLLEAFTL
jgi:hypothetical protein